MQEEGLTPAELRAAREYLSRQRSSSSVLFNMKCCTACDTSSGMPNTTLKPRHYRSKPHIAGVYQIPLNRLTKAIKIAKVMEALDG